MSKFPKIKIVQIPMYPDEYKEAIEWRNKKLKAKSWREMFGKLIEGDKW